MDAKVVSSMLAETLQGMDAKVMSSMLATTDREEAQFFSMCPLIPSHPGDLKQSRWLSR